MSFWLCERADGALRAVLCEVSNTFGERHAYLPDTGRPIANGMPLTARKVFHVSPICEVEGHHTFRFLFARATEGRPWRTLVRIDCGDANGPLLRVHGTFACGIFICATAPRRSRMRIPT
ncbi:MULTISPECIES: DUF1365 family protein [unclassified Caballeronia]|uniref:DUF1365 family protein n=1 Tax=unclassified Caballeronia TaxID=2646786 RepID=UPI00286B0070|nr:MULTISPECIES: DUF1365 family protein [unclassified Caballeronia]